MRVEQNYFFEIGKGTLVVWLSLYTHQQSMCTRLWMFETSFPALPGHQQWYWSVYKSGVLFRSYGILGGFLATVTVLGSHNDGRRRETEFTCISPSSDRQDCIQDWLGAPISWLASIESWFYRIHVNFVMNLFSENEVKCFLVACTISHWRNIETHQFSIPFIPTTFFIIMTQQGTNQYPWQPVATFQNLWQSNDTTIQPVWSMTPATSQFPPSIPSEPVPLARKRTWDDDASQKQSDAKRSRQPLGDITNQYYPSY